MMPRPKSGAAGGNSLNELYEDRQMWCPSCHRRFLGLQAMKAHMAQHHSQSKLGSEILILWKKKAENFCTRLFGLRRSLGERSIMLGLFRSTGGPESQAVCRRKQWTPNHLRGVPRNGRRSSGPRVAHGGTAFGTQRPVQGGACVT